jgi:hypothetical protein
VTRKYARYVADKTIRLLCSVPGCDMYFVTLHCSGEVLCRDCRESLDCWPPGYWERWPYNPAQ